MTTLAHPCLEVQTSEAPQPVVPPGLPKQFSLLSTCDGPGVPTGKIKPSRSRPCPCSRVSRVSRVSHRRCSFRVLNRGCHGGAQTGTACMALPEEFVTEEVVGVSLSSAGLATAGGSICPGALPWPVVAR